MLQIHPDTLLLPSDVALALGVSVSAVRSWERTGRLSALRTARGVRLFRGSDILRLQQERRDITERTPLRCAGINANSRLRARAARARNFLFGRPGGMWGRHRVSANGSPLGTPTCGQLTLKKQRSEVCLIEQHDTDCLRYD